MPVPTSLIGTATAPLTFAVDARATMAFAAGIGDLNPAYLDTTSVDGVVAHPLFPVTPEWPAVLAAGRLIPEVLSRAEAKASLHLTHDLTLHRAIRPGDELSTTATFDRVARHRAGAVVVLRLETLDQSGDPVCTTEFGSIYRGTDVVEDAEPARAAPGPPSLEIGRDLSTVDRHLDRGAAHIYTECARIWNPIHTDPAAARAAGLPDIVLHGTATLAMAVTAVVDRYAAGDPTRVRRVRARFGSTIALPSTATITAGVPDGPAVPTDGAALEPDESVVAFTVTTEDGRTALRDGSIRLGPPR